MRTLKEIKERYRKAPVMVMAVNAAIAKHGEDAVATVVCGTPSHSQNSNCRKTADYLGWKDYDIFVGSRAGKNKTDGFKNVLVKLS